MYSWMYSSLIIIIKTPIFIRFVWMFFVLAILLTILSFSIHWIHSVLFIICLIELAVVNANGFIIIYIRQVVYSRKWWHWEYLLDYNIWIALICIVPCIFRSNSNDEILSFDLSSLLPWKSWDIFQFRNMRHSTFMEFCVENGIHSQIHMSSLLTQNFPM